MGGGDVRAAASGEGLLSPHSHSSAPATAFRSSPETRYQHCRRGEVDSLSCSLGVFLEPGGHLFDLLALVFDDLLGHALRLEVVAVLELSPGHVDRTLVVGEHPADEATSGSLGWMAVIMGGCIFIIASM